MWATVLIFLATVFLIYFCLIQFNQFLKIKVYICYFVCFISLFLLFILWPFLLLSPKNARNGRLCCRFVRFLLQWTDLKWELRNGNIVAEDRAAILVSNHQSALDNIGITVVWNVCRKLTVISKKEVFYFWPIGLTFYLCGIIFIDRNDTKNAYKELNNTVKKLKESKTKIWIYPEGTRNKNLSQLLPFKKGAFITAVEAQIPIIPIVISPYHFFTKGNESLLLKVGLPRVLELKFGAGPIVIECLTPEPTEGLTAADLPALMKRVHERMDAKYKQLSEEVLHYNSSRDHSSRPLLEIKN